MTGTPDTSSSGGQAGRDLRIVVADDQTSVREGLVTIMSLTPGITVVGAAGDGRQALDLVDEHAPDAVLLDLHMPVLDGVQTAAALSARHPEVAIVVQTTYADDDSVLAAMRAGARGYLTKNADRSEIAQALRSAAGGLAVLDPTVHAALLAAVGPTPTDTRPVPPRELPDGLTAREAEILTLLANGLTNPEMAERLVVSPHTVKTHINRIFAKTGSRDRVAATAYAQAHDLAPRHGT